MIFFVHIFCITDINGLICIIGHIISSQDVKSHPGYD